MVNYLMNTSEISKTISHALRHEPWVYELEIDENGWVTIDELIYSINNIPEKNFKIDIWVIKKIIEESDKPRFEISNGKIRAMYGHSTPQKLKYTPSPPPEFLYHGTNVSLLSTIMVDGLKPMSRQYVHLSTNRDIARTVGLRKGKELVILKIRATEAFNYNGEFYQGNEYVWLCNYVTPAFIEVDGQACS